MEKKWQQYDITAIIVACLLITIVSIYFLLNTTNALAMADWMYRFITQIFGTLISWYALGLVLIGVFFCFSKYGNIRFGDEKPEFSTFAFIIMAACAGAGSGTIYWAFLEWGNYYRTPPFGIEPLSIGASDWVLTYALHHNGITAWAIYCIVSLPIAYSYYIKKHNTLRLSNIMHHILPEKVAKPLGRTIDIIYPLMVISGLIVVIGLGIPVISSVTALLFNIPNSLTLKLGIILGVTITYTMSSFIGVDKGMQNISKFGTWCIFALCFYVLLLGPFKFIIDQISSAVGLWLQNFIVMSTYTDSIRQGGFPQVQSTYFYAYWMIYSPMMAVFIPRILKGRTIREAILGMVGGGSLGSILLWGVLGSFMFYKELSGDVGVIERLNRGDGAGAIAQALNQLPLSSIIMGIFIIATIFLLATTLDSSAFSMACNTQRSLDENVEPNKGLKIFWCLTLIVIPIVFMIVDAPVASLQTSVFVFALPILVLFVFLLSVLFKWIVEDYGAMSAEEIKQKHKIS